MNLNVRKNPRAGLLTPESTAGSDFRVTVFCEKCRVPKPLSITHGRYGKVWKQPWDEVFEQVRFRCACGTLANALKVDRLGHDRPEEVLMVWGRGAYHG